MHNFQIEFFLFIIISLFLNEPVYSNRKATFISAVLILLFTLFVVFSKALKVGVSFTPIDLIFVFPLWVCFISQLLYSNHIFKKYRFYPRWYYVPRGLRNGLIFKHPNISLPVSKHDKIFSFLFPLTCILSIFSLLFLYFGFK
ncbi:hypothetical protein tinsulaeT_00100 [Thalassotalea insulae]|uniref:DUF3899 domain-containing protein n=1 Tax=Thalassotalea insulae TaxID=2056778 RepID=A0ABQ6GPN0_9GAMM|nr:hypothetical protein tinsulaeT_00100 [Thalassotalea insulae]